MKIEFQLFGNSNWMFAEEILPLAEPWIPKIGSNGFLHGPQQHKSHATCWIFNLSELELDFFWIIPPKDYLFIDFGFALHRISNMLQLFEIEHLGKKTGVSRSAHTNAVIKKALFKRKVQALFLQDFSTILVQPHFHVRFWAPSGMRNGIIDYLDSLGSKLKDTGCASYDDLAPYFELNSKGWIQDSFDITQFYLLEQRGYKFDEVTRDLLLVFSMEQSMFSTIVLPEEYVGSAGTQAAKRLLNKPLEDIQKRVTPALKMVMRLFRAPRSSYAGNVGVLSKDFLSVYEVALRIESFATLEVLERISDGINHPKLINWVEADGIPQAANLQKKMDESIASMNKEWSFINPQFDVSSWAWSI